MILTSKRSDDPDGSDFSAARIPKKWRRIFIAAGSIGAFLAGYLVTIRKAAPEPGKLIVSTAMERVENIQFQLMGLQGSLSEIKDELRQLKAQIRETKMALRSVENKIEPCDEDLAETRHGELLRAIEESAKKKKR